MNSANIVNFKAMSVALLMVMACVCATYATTRLAVENKENITLRQHNRVLVQRLKDLDQNFNQLRAYTHSVHALASADIEAIIADKQNDATINFASVKNTVLGSDIHSDAETFAVMLDTISDLNQNATNLVKRLENLAIILKSRKDMFNEIPSMMPTEGRIASDFGIRLSPFEGKRHMHAGIDIAATIGEKIKAPADGEVTFSGNFETLGNSLVLNHGNDILTRYGHTSRILVRKGQKVKRGQVIALVGNSGRSTGPHLHYEVWVHNKAVDPRNFFFDITAKPTFMAKTRALETLPKNSPAALTAMGGDL